MSSRVVLVSLGGDEAQELAGALARLDLSVSVAGDLRDAMAELSDAQLIVVAGSDTPSLALLCRRINDEAGSSHPPILAVVAGGDVETRVSVLEAGADDVLAQPVDERELSAMVDALLLRSTVAVRSQLPVVAAPKPPAAPGRVIVFAAAKGGAGTTSLAVNVALVLAEMAPGNVCIADLDMYRGQVSTHLDIYGRGSTAGLAAEDLHSLPADFITDAGRLHPSGLMVYGGPYRPDEAHNITGERLTTLVNRLRSMYATVVVDAGTTLDARTIEVINSADRVALVITPDIPALRLLHAGLEVLSDAGSAADRTTFVVNDLYPKSSISAEQIEEHLTIKVGLTVPYDSENILRGINEGNPIVSLARRSPATAAIRRLAEMLAETSAENGEATTTAATATAKPQKRSRFGSLLGRN